MINNEGGTGYEYSQETGCQRQKKMKFRNKCKFQIWGYLSGSRLAVFWEIHANTSKETLVAIYTGEDVTSHKNESFNRNFTVFSKPAKEWKISDIHN